MHCTILVHAIADESRRYMQHAIYDESIDTSNTRAGNRTLVYNMILVFSEAHDTGS